MSFTKNVLVQDWWDARIQHGTVNFSNSTSVTVTFPIAFTLTPVVMVNPLADPAKRWWVESITTTSFIIKFNSAVTLTMAWLAIQRD